MATGAILPTLEITEYRLRLARDLMADDAPQLRGFFGSKFAGQVLLHHHRPDGSLLYEYPRVQFKVLHRMGLVVGVAEGSELLSRLWLEIGHATLGHSTYPVLEATIRRRTEQFGETDRAVRYRFLTPWLALNQENERCYRAARHRYERTALVERILVGHCLSFAKSFDHMVKSKLQANCGGLTSVRTTLKGVPMRGFVGSFTVNFFLPDYLGIGKSVSRGFGTVQRIADAKGDKVVQPDH